MVKTVLSDRSRNGSTDTEQRSKIESEDHEDGRHSPNWQPQLYHSRSKGSLEQRKRKREQVKLKTSIWSSSPSPPNSPRYYHSTRSSRSKERSSYNNKQSRSRSLSRSRSRSRSRSNSKERDQSNEENLPTQSSVQKFKLEEKADTKDININDKKKNSSSSSDSESESGSEDEKKKKHKKHKKHHTKKQKVSHNDNSNDKSEEQKEVENEEDSSTFNEIWLEKKAAETSSSIPVVGPNPLPKIQAGSYGGALMPGEGEAIAQYIQQNKRIPRRGEVGLTSDEIESFEDMGYVMSGSRHKRMNAIRIRKENQVYSAEEKRALALFNYEEKAKRENKILADFRDMVKIKDY